MFEKKLNFKKIMDTLGLIIIILIGVYYYVLKPIFIDPQEHRTSHYPRSYGRAGLSHTGSHTKKCSSRHSCCRAKGSHH